MCKDLTETSQNCSVSGSNSQTGMPAPSQLILNCRDSKEPSRRVLNLYVLNSVTSVKAPLANTSRQEAQAWVWEGDLFAEWG